jgi:hypothetical protein
MIYSQLVEATAQDLAVFYGDHRRVYMDLVNAFSSNNVFIANLVLDKLK